MSINPDNFPHILNRDGSVRYHSADEWFKAAGITLDNDDLGCKLKRKQMDTIGNLIDKLTIVNVRIWMAEDIKRAKDATDKQIADATRITNIANQQRNNLIEEIDKALGINNPQGSTKMYGKTI